MKKLVLTIALAGAVTFSYGQGTVNVGNSGNLVSFKPTSGAAAAIPGSNTAVYRFAVLYGPQALVATPYAAGADVSAYIASLGGYDVAPIMGVNHATAAGRVIFPVGIEGLPLPGTSGGNVRSLLMVGWLDTGGLTTLAGAANSTYFGTSGDVELLLGGGTTPVPYFFGADRTSPNKQTSGFVLFEAAIVPAEFRRFLEPAARADPD